MVSDVCVHEECQGPWIRWPCAGNGRSRLIKPNTDSPVLLGNLNGAYEIKLVWLRVPVW